jgi:hypothetical protein
MDKVSRKCDKCDHDLFTTYYDVYRKYYCDIHHPDKIRRVRERREFENRLLGIKGDDLVNDEKSRLEIFYETILEKKNKEIRKLEKMNKKLTNVNEKLVKQLDDIEQLNKDFLVI